MTQINAPLRGQFRRFGLCSLFVTGIKAFARQPGSPHLGRCLWEMMPVLPLMFLAASHTEPAAAGDQIADIDSPSTPCAPVGSGPAHCKLVEIGASLEQVENGNRIAAGARVTIGEIVGNADRISALMGQIATASREQTSGVRQVGSAVQELDRSTHQNAALVEETSASAGLLSDQAQRLAQELSFFKMA